MPRRLPVIPYRWLFPRSLRGRYLLLSLLATAGLLTAAAFGWYYVRSTTAPQIERIQWRTEADMVINDLGTTTRRLEVLLNELLSSPDAAHIRTLRAQQRLLNSTTLNLRQLRWFRTDPTLQSILTPLGRDIDRLQKNIDELVRIRRSSTAWFPAMKTLEEEMLPQNNRINAMIALSMSELDNSAPEPLVREYRHALEELRYLVERRISEFRLLIANRFGVFSDTPFRAISRRLKNIELYNRQIDVVLKQLDERESNPASFPDLTYGAADLRAAISLWSQSQKRVTGMLVADDWRRDVSYFEQRIQPLIARTQQRLESIKLELGVGSARDITRLTAVANRLSGMVVLLAAGGIFALWLWFVIFKRSLLVPVARIADALRHEARDGEPLPLPEGKVAETRLLTEAFDEMRSQVRSRQAHLDYLAYHDTLTGLPNRALFRDRLQHAVDRAMRDGRMVALLFLDLDRFKQINDTLGHDTGDQLLCKMAARLRDNIRTADTVARLGGDEFAVIIEDIDDTNQVVPIAEKLLNSFEEAFTLEHRQLHATTSIGIAICPANGSDVETLFRHADTAMYCSKARSPNGYCFYNDEMTARMNSFLLTEFQLRNAVRNQEFVLHYHPIIDVASGKVAAFEALLRWNHGKRGLLLPGEFIDVLEETGLIMPVSHWIIHRALADFADFSKACDLPLAITINFSPRLLQNNNIVNILGQALESSTISSGNVIIEITEDALIQEQGIALKVLTALKDMGVRIAIDDFGKGQSSLSRLRKLPIDIVKIDKDFVAEVPENSDDSELISAIIAMAHKLNKWVIAEGVESHAQHAFLIDHECDAVQGFLFSKPLPANQTGEFLRHPPGTLSGSALRRKART